ncbi:hypothetical protein CYMTET_5745, partial [Cymbomonas tetramitiformis]
ERLRDPLWGATRGEDLGYGGQPYRAHSVLGALRGGEAAWIMVGRATTLFLGGTQGARPWIWWQRDHSVSGGHSEAALDMVGSAATLGGHSAKTTDMVGSMSHSVSGGHSGETAGGYAKTFCLDMVGTKLTTLFLGPLEAKTLDMV